MKTEPSEIDEALNRLASMLRLVAQRLTTVSGSLRSDGSSEEAAHAHGTVVEHEANELELAALQASPVVAVEIIRMTSDVRRMDDLVGRLAAMSGTLSGNALSVEMRDRLRRMCDLTLTLVDQTRDAIAGHDAELANKAAAGEALLDDWYDLLLGDMFEDVAESGVLPPMFFGVAKFAKLLERIGDRSVETAESAARMLSAQREHA